MQRYVIDNNKNTNVEDFQMRDMLLSKLKKRFTTYGYKQVRTSTFESYDMYSNIIGTVNKDEMIKVIDTSGKVLVLRPDVTIPLNRMTTLNGLTPDNQRLFYILDVFRQSHAEADEKESTQAGIECFGDNSAEVDSEVIMMAIHTFQDLGFSNFKLEIGHAGFFKELIQQANLNEHELESLQALIQSKNLVDIEPFLSQLNIDEDVRVAIQSIPMLYGNPENVIDQAKSIIRNDSMKEILQNLIDVYEILQAYGAENSVVFNLGLINNMNYYSGIIFQGFVDNIGKPVLMGGRYDNLGKQFNQPSPAVGFAFEVDLLIHAIQQQELAQPQSPVVDVIIHYNESKQQEALRSAYVLRDNGLQVLTYLNNKSATQIRSSYIAEFNESQNKLISRKIEKNFSNPEELLALLQKEEN
ncbi:ATP phosphoribosyltransferase regulatory subunit [Oceanobacillus halophilus]|uniref:ATP phosphoribosyltransferase regulatory subunit n=1 Tax=Oceanobacillus halophilus TaxID=930130 RepID=A0A495A124_9BACI|nr:ATP phosphoribosyltransferase regulatory subunit [Oceanobacillus halophilus]RKQ33168.1 ATP phosphoribosyltransferase regulatory subunit [Oceanobacillus halophilus]